MGMVPRKVWLFFKLSLCELWNIKAKRTWAVWPHCPVNSREHGYLQPILFKHSYITFHIKHICCPGNTNTLLYEYKYSAYVVQNVIWPRITLQKNISTTVLFFQYKDGVLLIQIPCSANSKILFSPDKLMLLSRIEYALWMVLSYSITNMMHQSHQKSPWNTC